MAEFRVSEADFRRLQAIKGEQQRTEQLEQIEATGQKRTGADVADDALQTAKKVGRAYLIACAVGLVFLLPWVLWVFATVFRGISHH